jgi:hypothetical protein
MTKGIIYKLTVTTDIVHGWTTDIFELYIPEEDIAVNISSSGTDANSVRCFSLKDRNRRGDCDYNPDKIEDNYHERRYSGAKIIREVSVDFHVIDKLKVYIESKDRIEGIKSELYSLINDDPETTEVPKES